MSRALVAFVLVAAVFAFGAYIALAYPLNHDVAWLLYVGKQVLHGVPLYDRVVEVNPPLIIWFSAITVWLAHAFGVWDATLFRVLVLVMIAVSLWLCRRNLSELPPLAREVITLLLAYALIAGVGFEFGQREHIAIVLVLPFLFLTARQLTAFGALDAGDMAAGVLAGFGFALKPHFVLVWLLLEAYLLLRRDGRRIALSAPHIVVASVLLVYAIAVMLFARAYFPLLALVAAPYNLYVNVDRRLLLRLPATVWAFAAIVVSLAVVRSRPWRDLTRVLAICCGGFLLMVIFQARAWTYHWIPSSVLAAVLFAIVLLSFIARAQSERFTPIVAGAFAVILLAATSRHVADVGAQYARLQGKAYQLRGMVGVVDQYAKGQTIAALSSNMQAGFPLVNYKNLTWGLRFNSLWLLPGVYPPAERTNPPRYHDIAAMGAAERYMFDAVVEDLARSKPALLVIDTMPPGYVLYGFDYLDYFGRDARFASFMKSYNEVAPVERYRIFVRAQNPEQSRG